MPREKARPEAEVQLGHDPPRGNSLTPSPQLPFGIRDPLLSCRFYQDRRVFVPLRVAVGLLDRSVEGIPETYLQVVNGWVEGLAEARVPHVAGQHFEVRVPGGTIGFEPVRGTGTADLVE